MRPSTARAKEQLDPRQQLANTSPPHSTTPGLHPISIHQMAPPKRTSDCSSLLIYRARKDERLSWPSWLTCSGRFTHITGHSSDAGRAQDRESSPAKDRRSTTVPRHQPPKYCKSGSKLNLPSAFNHGVSYSNNTQGFLFHKDTLYMYLRDIAMVNRQSLVFVAQCKAVSK